MPRVSVVIPTRNRSELLRGCLESLERQTLAADSFEVIVVVDGSSDDTVELLGRRSTPYRLRWIVLDHAGLSAARNRGTQEAVGELILCLDDDMIAAPELVEAHLAAQHDARERLVQGALAIHGSVPRTPFVVYQERLLEATRRKLSDDGSVLHSEEVSGGNVSIRKQLLEQVGGFNERLKALRNTDGELAHRLERRGIAIHYAPRALASMTHVNDLDGALHASFLYGRSYVFLQPDLPETRWKLSPLVADRCSLLRNLARRSCFLAGPRRSRALVRTTRLAIRASEALRARSLSAALYRLALDGRFWEGVRAESGGDLASYRPRGVPILCYHQVSDARNDAFRTYVLPVGRFRRQMRWLVRRGYRAISLDVLCDYLERGAALPPKPVVITFDDGYRDLATTATPLLAKLGYPHVHFMNSGKLGGTTDWIARASDLPILSAAEIRAMVERYGTLVDFQAHSRNHLCLPEHDRRTVQDEVRHSIETLEPLIGRPVRYLAYPFGEQNDETRAAVAELPIRCSFTVDQGLCRPGQDPQRLPRVEIFTHDLPLDFRFKVLWGFGPVASARRRLKRIYNKVVRRLGRRRPK